MYYHEHKVGNDMCETTAYVLHSDRWREETAVVVGCVFESLNNNLGA